MSGDQISVRCQCGQKLLLGSNDAGRRFRCPKCGKELTGPSGKLTSSKVQAESNEPEPSNIIETELTELPIVKHDYREGDDVFFACPQCKVRLKSPVSQMGQPDSCKACQAKFIVQKVKFVDLFNILNSEIIPASPKPKERGQINCPYCDLEVAANARFLGQDMRCPHCHGRFRAPKIETDFTGCLILIAVFILVLLVIASLPLFSKI